MKKKIMKLGDLETSENINIKYCWVIILFKNKIAHVLPQHSCYHAAKESAEASSTKLFDNEPSKLELFQDLAPVKLM